jgi:superkiller protein 3
LADLDEWRSAFRAAVWRGDSQTVKQLAARQEPAALPPASAYFLCGHLWRIGESGSALQLALAVRQRHPDDVWVNQLLALFHYYLNPPRLDQSIRYFTAVVALRPRDAGPHYNLGLALTLNGSHEESLAAFSRALELQPDHLGAWLNQGNAYRGLKQWDRALACYRKAIALEPRYAAPHNNLGSVLEAQGERDQALAAYQEAARLDPKLSHAHKNVGRILAKKGKLDEALAAFQEAARLEPKDAFSHDNLSTIWRLKQRPDEAIAAARQAIRVNPGYAPAHLHLGQALLGKGVAQEAIRAFEEAIRLQPDLEAAWLNLAWVLTSYPDPKFRDSRRALELARKGVKLAPQSPVHWQLLGWACYRSELWSESLEALQHSIALQKDGGHPRQWFFLAMAHGQLGHEQEARKWYDRSVQWMEKTRSRALELHRFRAEAAELLGVKEKKP